MKKNNYLPYIHNNVNENNNHKNVRNKENKDINIMMMKTPTKIIEVMMEMNQISK